MTASDAVPVTLAGGFDFARRQRDPEFRNFLREIGWTTDQHVIVALDDEPVRSVLSRIVQNGASNPCLIAIPCEGAQFGFKLMFAASVRAHRWPWSNRGRKTDQVDLGPDASIGMLYDSFSKCREYVPGEWLKPVVFQRVKTPA